MKKEMENLILLEFMVNRIDFFEKDLKVDKCFLASLGFTCVQIMFRGAALVEIREDESCTRVRKDDGNLTLNFGCGKSCLFSLNRFMTTSCYDATACILRKAPEDEKMEYYPYGKAVINMQPIFKALCKSRGLSTVTKCMRGEYDIRDGQCEKVGAIDLFLRMTDLGKMIITKFHLGARDSSFYFKGTDEKIEDDDDEDESSGSTCADLKTVDYSELRQPQQMQMQPQQMQSQQPYSGYSTRSVPTPIGPPPGMYGQEYGYSGGRQMAPQGRGDYNPRCCSDFHAMGKRQQQQQKPCPHSMQQQPCQGGMGGMDSYPPQNAGPCAGGPSGMNGAYQQEYRDEDYEKLEGEYKEISAEVNGYEIKIKLLRRPKKGKDE